MIEEVTPAEELQNIGEQLAEICDLNYVTLTSPRKEKRNAISIQGGHKNKFILSMYDDNHAWKIIVEGAPVTIKKAVNQMALGCQLKADSFNKECEQLGGVATINEWRGKSCQFLDPANKPHYSKDWMAVNKKYQMTEEEIRYDSNQRNIVRIDYVHGAYGNAKGYYAWVYTNSEHDSYGTFKSIKTDEKTFTEWINNRSWRISRDDLWSDTLSEEKRKEMYDDLPYAEEKEAKRQEIRQRADSFETTHARRDVIVSFFGGSWSPHRWEAGMEYPDIEEAQSIIKEYSNKLKEEGRKDDGDKLYRASHLLREHFQGPYNSPYDPEKFLRKHMKASAFDEWNDIDDIVRDAKNKIDWIDAESTREEFKDDLNWNDFDKAKKKLARVEKKVKADKHYTREAESNFKRAKDARDVVKFFEETIEDKWNEEEE